MKVTKKYICKEISDTLNLSTIQTKDILNSFIEIIKKKSHKMPVKINRFGTFYKHTSPERIGRNPKTKETFTIPPIDKILFSSSNKIKKYIN